MDGLLERIAAMILLDRVNVCQWRRKIKTFFLLSTAQGILQDEKKLTFCP